MDVHDARMPTLTMNMSTVITMVAATEIHAPVSVASAVMPMDVGGTCRENDRGDSHGGCSDGGGSGGGSDACSNGGGSRGGSDVLDAMAMVATSMVVLCSACEDVGMGSG
eukprot:365475-Chlamydomonas_euryale.AAC.13